MSNKYDLESSGIYIGLTLDFNNKNIQINTESQARNVQIGGSGNDNNQQGSKKEGNWVENQVKLSI